MYYINSGFYPTNAVYLFNGDERGKQILQWQLPGTADRERRPVTSGEVAAFCRKHGLKLVRNVYEQGWLIVAETERQQFEFKLWFDAAPPFGRNGTLTRRRTKSRVRRSSSNQVGGA